MGNENIPQLSMVSNDSMTTIINTDKQRVQQIVLNLLSNALKFTPNKGSVKICCRMIRKKADLHHGKDFPEIVRLVSNMGVNGMLEVAIIDTGIGIKKSDCGKLFQLFGFIDTSAKLNTRGIGLGLHICRMICMQMGGNIFCKSQKDKGSTFVFVIALDAVNNENQIVKLHRQLNPKKQHYQKIKLSKKVIQRLALAQANKDGYGTKMNIEKVDTMMERISEHMSESGRDE